MEVLVEVAHNASDWGWVGNDVGENEADKGDDVLVAKEGTETGIGDRRYNVHSNYRNFRPFFSFLP